MVYIVIRIAVYLYSYHFYIYRGFGVVAQSLVKLFISREEELYAKNRQVVIVEGYTDVMAAHLAGVTTAVATCGTAFGEEHIRIIRSL